MPAFKAAYLIHGDDHGRVSERRGRLRALAESTSGAGGVELLDGEDAAPAAVALTLSAMTLTMGRRFVVVEGCERWKDADVTAHIAPALAALDAETTVAFFAREDARTQAPRALHDAVRAAGGDISAEVVHKTADLPRWAIDQARRLGLRLEGAAAQALVASVGDRQQRLLRELEKLALEYGDGATVGVEEVEASAAASAERQVWALVDAIVGGERAAAVAAYGVLRAQGENAQGLIPQMGRRVREVAAIAEQLEAGATPAEVKASMKGSPWAADRRIREARGSDVQTLRRALDTLARLELATRGGSQLEPDTEATRALLALAG